jgi:hypothetical protein
MSSTHVILLVATVCLTLGGLGGHYYSATKHQQELRACTLTAAQAKTQVTKLCAGYNLGPLRVSEVVCNNKHELCFCGSPDELNNLR